MRIVIYTEQGMEVLVEVEGVVMEVGEGEATSEAEEDVMDQKMVKPVSPLLTQTL